MFNKGDYTGAKAGVQAMLSRATISAAERDHLNRQLSICDARLGLPSTVLGRGAGGEGDVLTSSPSHPLTRSTNTDCGPRALQLIIRRYGTDASLESITRDAGTTEKGTTLDGLSKAATKRGLKAEGVQVNLPALKELNSPAIAWVDGNHYVAVLKSEGGRVKIQDPNKPSEEVMTAEELLKMSGGILLKVSRK